MTATLVLRSALTTAAIFLGSLCCELPAWAQSSDSANLSFVGRLNSSIKRAMAGSSDLHVAAQRLCEDLSQSVLDLEAMMTTASVGSWPRMDHEQSEAYRTAFRRRVIKDCASNAADYLRGNVELAGARVLPSGERIIGTRSKGTDAEKILMWQVRFKEHGILVVTDVFVDGRSAMLSLREQASLSLERDPGDVSALIGILGR